MRKSLFSIVVIGAAALGIACTAETTEPTPAPAPAPTAVEQPTGTPEQPTVAASGVEAEGVLYQKVLVSKKLHDAALGGTNYVLTAQWTYTCPVTPPTDAKVDIKVAELDVTKDQNPDYVNATIKLKVDQATKVMKATANIDLAR